MSEECCDEQYSECLKGKGKMLFDPTFFRIQKKRR